MPLSIMGIEILIAIAAAALSTLGYSIATAEFVEKLVRTLLKRPKAVRQKTYAERLARLTESLRHSSAEVDAVLEEVAGVAQEREATAARLEQQLEHLQSREKNLQERIEHLEKVPISVAEYLASVATAGEKRGARRDYMLFGLGVGVTTLLSVLFFVLQAS